MTEESFAPLRSADAETVASSPLSHLGRRLLVPAVLALLSLIGLAAYADVRRLADSVIRFDWFVLAPVLALSLANYGLRALRWHVYLRRLGAPLSWRQSVAVLLSGFALGITPGRTGELGKGWLVRALGGGAARRGVAAVLAERLTDGLGICCALLLVGLLPGSLIWLAALGGTILVVGAAFLYSDHVSHAVLALAERTPGVRSRAHLLAEVLQSVRELLSPGALTAGVLVGAFAWLTEIVSCWLIVRTVANDASLSAVAVLYTVSMLVGTISLLPGGLVATEGAMALAIGRLGLSAPEAATVTLMTRAATLWFGVALGLLVLPWLWKWIRARHREGVGAT